MEQSKYCAFISYRHLSPDQEIAKALHTAIETYHIPSNIQKKTGKKRMGRVFRDQEELPLSADLGADIETALDSSDWLIVVCSPRYQQSRWCMRELEYFVEHKGRERVIAILAEGEPGETFPDEIRYSVDSEGNRIEIDPHAADVRGADLKESFKKLKNEKLRLLAPMLSVTYDELKRRERQRRRKKILISAAAVFVAAVGLGTFLTVSHIRNEALKREAAAQQAIAEEQARLAEERRKLAEEEQRRAEEERKKAVYNDLGERMERAAAALSEGEKREAAKILTDAIAISDEEEQMRRDEILALMRRTMYIEPFTIVSSFNNQNMQLNFIAASPDGTRAVGVVNNNSIAMVDLVQNEILYTVTADNAIMMYPEFSQDGTRFLADCDYGRFVQVWNTEDGSEAFRYTSKLNAPYEIGTHYFWKDADTLLVQDQDKLLLVSSDGTEKVFYTLGDQMEDYDPAKNLMSQLLGGVPLDKLFSNVQEGYAGIQVLVSDDRERVVVSGKAGELAVIVLDSEGKRLFIPSSPLDDSSKMAGTFAEKWKLSPDGKTLCCLSFYLLIAGWDVDTGQMIYIDVDDRELMNTPTEPVFTPDSSRMAYAIGNVLHVCDARSNQPILTANLDDTMFVPSIAFSDDGKYLLMTNEAMFIINTENWAAELIVSAEGTNFNGIIPMKNMVLCSRYDGVIFFYSLPALSSIETSSTFDGALMDPYLPQRAVECVSLISQHELSPTFKQTNYYKDYPPQLFFSIDGSVAAMAHPDGTIELFDTQGDGTVKDTVGQLYTYINALALTEDRLIAIDVETRMMVYNLKTKSVEKIWNNGTQYSSFAFNEDSGLMMAMCAGQTKIDVFDLNDGCRLLFSMHATEDTFTDMAFSSDGAYAVGKTAAGQYVIGNLFANEEELIARTTAFAIGKQ